ncbi:MAG: FtsX-like permease family protein [Burkholderiaceae bacterium]|nr:MAG: FtsX-like permease family protein [Burkholderiaceae bacterium]
MNALATLRIALNALRINKLRSALTMLGIVIGVAAVIVMIAIGHGAQARVEEQIKSLGSNLMIMLPGSTTAGGVRLGTGAQQRLSEDDGMAVAREVPEVQVVAPTLRGSGQIVVGNQNWSTQIQGVTPDYFEAREWNVSNGRAFDDNDMSGAMKIVILGQSVVQQLFGTADPVGQVIRVRRVPCLVVGVLESKGQSMSGQDQDDIVLLPINTARNRVLGSEQGSLRRVNSLLIKTRAGADMKAAEEKIRALMRQRHKVQDGAEESITLRNLTEMLQAQEASSRVMALLLAAVASVSLLVGGIGIMNIMLVSVTERTREIGLRMAVGARARDILQQFLVEATTLSLIGGLVGIALGVGGSALVAYLADWPTALEPLAIVLAIGFAAGIGIFFGYYPARKASRLLPIEALRYE